MLSFSLTPSLAFLFLQYFGSYHCEQKSEELIKIKQQMCRLLFELSILYIFSGLRWRFDQWTDLEVRR
ncbi:hypothetical protein SDJN03_23416, partial [Cucurbita argyrosperma subsp. sororia]